VTTFLVAVPMVSDRGDISIQGLVQKGILKPGMKWNVEGKSFVAGRMLDRSAENIGKVKELKEAKEGQVVQVFLAGGDAPTVKKLQRRQVIEFV
jgi:hypothetical protein